MKSLMGITVYCLLFIGSLAYSDYVYFTVSNDNFPCDDNDSSCLSVNELSRFSQIDRVHLQFHPGKYLLNKTEFVLFENVTEVHMITNASTTEIVCTNSSGMMFLGVDNVSIVNISLLYCGGPVHMYSSSINIEASALFVHSVSNLMLDNVRVFNSTSVGIFIAEAYGTTHIQNSVISGSSVANMVCIWNSSNASLVNTSHSFDFVVNKLTVMHGGDLYHTNGLSGGINVQVGKSMMAGNIILNNITLLSNSGHTGGNLQISTSQCIGDNQCHSVSITLSNSLLAHGKALSGGGLSFTGNCLDCDLDSNKYGFYNACHHVLVVSNTSIFKNQALERGGGMNIYINESFDLFNVFIHGVKLISNTVYSKPLLNQPETLFTGGGLHFYLTLGGHHFRNRPALSITQCKFQSNKAFSGAGLRIIVIAGTGMYSTNNMGILIVIKTSKMLNNTADIGAGAVFSVHDNTISSLHSDISHQISIQSCLFESNSATSASGLLVSVLGGSAFDFQMCNVSFIDNNVKLTSFNDIYYGVSSTLFLRNVDNFSLSNSTFHHNTGSGMGAVLSRIHTSGFLNFSHNTAVIGSGMHLISSYLALKTSSNITFTHNHASEVGGAIYTIITPPISCFYTFETGNATNQHFQFIDNTATLAGSILYEHTLGNCALSKSTSVKSQFHQISKVTSQSLSLVASNPYQVCICHQENDTYDCDSRFISISIITGSPLVLSLLITDQNGQATPGFITYTINGTNEISPKQQYYYSGSIDGSVCSDFTYSAAIHGNSEHLVLSAKNYQQHTVGVYESLDIFLSLLPCPLGFQISKTGKQCDCLPYLTTNSLLHCNDENFSIARLSKHWVGLSEGNDVILYDSCPFGYCTSEIVIIYELNNSSVCVHGRLGTLCGGCKDTLSWTLGNDSCTECSDNFISLVLAFAALGIVLVITVTFLSLTITEGTMNAVIFYAAFLHLNRTSFFQSYDNRNFIVIFISWLNLDFGFNVCFYNGMTSYAKVWLQFLFPIYLYTIEIIIIVSSYRSSKLARITGAKNRLKIMSTIFLLGYMKMLRSVITIFSYANIQSPNNSSEVMTVWLYDGNIEYYSSHHTPLFAIAVLYTVIISFPYTSYLLFVQLFQRLPYFPCEVKRDGIADAHVGPYKDKFRFWLGLLLFSYTILVIIYYPTGGDRGINLTALTVVCSSLLLLNTIFGGVYKNKILNSLESLFFLNLIILSVVVLQISNSNNGNIKIALYSVVTAAFIQIFISIAYHFYNNGCCIKKDENSESTSCMDLFSWKPWKKHKIYHYPWSNNYKILDEELMLNTFETEYENASNLIEGTNEDYSFSSVSAVDLVPNSWLPTKYPLARFREDPNLLKSAADESDSLPSPSSNESSSKPPIPELIRLKPSFLVVNEIEEEANLITDPDSDILRLQRLSVDNSGNRTYIVEDNEYLKDNHSSEASIPTTEKETPLNPKTEVSKDKDKAENVDINELPTTTTTTDETETETTSLHQKSDPTTQKCSYSNLRNRKHFRSPHTYAKKNSKMKVRKRPQSGSICYKCDPSLFLQSKIKRFKVNSAGGDCLIPSHDITIKIPPSVIGEDVLLDIEVGVMLNGPFIFPPCVRPISPIIWICVRNKILLHFSKPVEITLPHFLTNIDQNTSKTLGIQFMKASHHARVLPNGTKSFTFDHIGNDSTTQFTSHRGTLKTLHFCFLCIAAPESRALFDHASYCLLRVHPNIWNPSNQKQEIYFVVSYFMKTCLQCLENQISSGEQRIERRECFQFSDQNDSDPKLSIKLSENRPGDQWLLAVEGFEITASMVDFWKLYDQGADLEYMAVNRMYPPRFKLSVYGKNAVEPAIAQITFNGSINNLDTEIILEPGYERCRTPVGLGGIMNSGGSSSSGRWTMNPPEGISDDEWELLKHEPDWVDLQNYIFRVSARWKEIGYQLEIKPYVLDMIEVNHASQGVLRQCTEVMSTWQKNSKPPFVWATLIEVLTRECIGEYALAMELCKDIIKKQRTY